MATEHNEKSYYVKKYIHVYGNKIDYIKRHCVVYLKLAKRVDIVVATHTHDNYDVMDNTVVIILQYMCFKSTCAPWTYTMCQLYLNKAEEKIFCTTFIIKV